MRKLAIVLLILIQCSITIAQNIEVSNVVEKIAGGEKDAISATIYQSSEQLVKKEWKSLMKGLRSEKVTVKREIFADNAFVSGISNNTVDIYAKVEGLGNGSIKLVAAFDLGGVFLSPSHEGFKHAQKILHDFAVKLTRMGIEEELKDKEKELAKGVKELENLKKDNDRLHQNIDRSNRMIEEEKNNIEKAKQDIETNLKDQITAKKTVEDLKSTVARVGEKLKKVK
jgi:hypothetical protein